MHPMKFNWKKTVALEMPLVDFIASHSNISKSQIKKALNLGGGWLQKDLSSKKKRCRRAQTLLKPGNVVWFFFDEHLLLLKPPTPALIQDTPDWSLWYKPADLMSQGSPYGDKGCILQQIETTLKKPTFLIHRLDKEASGLMVFAHHKKAAARLSQLWQSKGNSPGEVQKFYQAEVEGCLDTQEGSIDHPLDGKKSTTHYRVHRILEKSSLVNIRIETGRFHQIRRHFAQIGHPLLGDPKYNQRPQSKPLQLVAQKIIFQCPFRHTEINTNLPKSLSLF